MCPWNDSGTLRGLRRGHFRAPLCIAIITGIEQNARVNIDNYNSANNADRARKSTRQNLLSKIACVVEVNN
jgi:hypothetical protein